MEVLTIVSIDWEHTIQSFKISSEGSFWGSGKGCRGSEMVTCDRSPHRSEDRTVVFVVVWEMVGMFRSEKNNTLLVDRLTGAGEGLSLTLGCHQHGFVKDVACLVSVNV